MIQDIAENYYLVNLIDNDFPQVSFVDFIFFLLSFVLNKVFVAAGKHNTKINKTGFILYACVSPPLNNCV